MSNARNGNAPISLLGHMISENRAVIVATESMLRITVPALAMLVIALMATSGTHLGAIAGMDIVLAAIGVSSLANMAGVMNRCRSACAMVEGGQGEQARRVLRPARYTTWMAMPVVVGSAVLALGLSLPILPLWATVIVAVTASYVPTLAVVAAIDVIEQQADNLSVTLAPMARPGADVESGAGTIEDNESDWCQ